jgi:tetratricopeptide (TPR) repeat protein
MLSGPMARDTKVRRRPCYECARRVAIDAASCPHCGAVLQTFCACGAHVSVFAKACPLCEAPLQPRRFRARYPWIAPTLACLLALAALFGLYVFVYRGGESERAKALSGLVFEFEQGEFEAARSSLERYHAKFGEEPQTLSMLAECCRELSRLEECRQVLARMRERSPADRKLAVRLLGCLMEMGRTEEVETLAREAIARFPTYAPIQLRLADLAERRGDLTEAVAAVRRAQDGEDPPPGTGTRLALLLLDSGRTSEGIRLLARQVRLPDASPETVRALARALALAPDAEESARTDGRAALSRWWESTLRDPGRGIVPLPLRARVALAVRETAEARRLLDDAGKVRTLAPEELLLLARAGSLAGPRSTAILGKLASRSDLPAGLANELAAAWLEAGRPEKALDLLAGPCDSPRLNAERRRLLVRARLWLLAGETPGVPAAAARGLEALRAAEELLGERPGDERGAVAATLSRKLLSRIDGILRGDPAPAPIRISVVPGREVDTLRSLYRPPRLRDGPDAEARRQLRSALWSGSRLAAGGTSPDARDPALRAGLEALAGDLAAATAVVRAGEFAESDLRDRALAAAVLAGRGRPAVAEALLAELEAPPEEGDGDLLRGDLLLALGRRAEARAAYESAADENGEAAAAALLGLARTTGPAEQEAVLPRLLRPGPR